MNDNQINRVEMTQATLRVLDQYRAAWAGSLDTADDVTALENHLATVRDAGRRQADPTEAVTNVKNELRQGVRTSAINLAAALRAYALRRDLTELAGRFAATASEVGDLRDLDLAEYSEMVVAAAQDHADGEDGLLARTSVTAEEIAALDALDDEFADALDTPRAAIIARSRATAQIAEGLSAIHTLFKEHLDPEVARLAAAHPDFNRDYRAARVVVDRGRGTSPPPPTDT